MTSLGVALRGPNSRVSQEPLGINTAGSSLLQKQNVALKIRPDFISGGSNPRQVHAAAAARRGRKDLALNAVAPCLSLSGDIDDLDEGKMINDWEHKAEVENIEDKEIYAGNRQLPANVYTEMDYEKVGHPLICKSREPILSKEECESIIFEAESKNWGTQRHSAFPTTDIQIQVRMSSCGCLVSPCLVIRPDPESLSRNCPNL